MYLLLLPWSGNAPVPRCDIDASLSLSLPASFSSSRKHKQGLRSGAPFASEDHFLTVQQGILKKCIKNKNISKAGPFQNFIKIGIVAPRAATAFVFAAAAEGQSCNF
jgi:hypothetical protein